MKRVYRLLRNNIEYGPYTIDELLGQTLRPSDMVWIEGQSSAWAHLSEFELIMRPVENEEIPRSLRPATDEIEEKADEIRREVMKHHPHAIHSLGFSDHDEGRSYISTADQDKIEFVDHRPRKNHMLNDVLMTALIVGLFAGSLYGGRTVFNTTSKSPVVNKSFTSSGDQHEARGPEMPVKNPVAVPADSPALSQDSLARPSVAETRKEKKPDSTARSIENQEPQIPDSLFPSSLETKPKIIQLNTTKEHPVERTGPVVPADEKKDSAKQDEKKKGFFKKLFGKRKKDAQADN